MWKLLLLCFWKGGTSSEEDDLHVIANLHHGVLGMNLNWVTNRDSRFSLGV
jgi:hypothetical protein